MKLHHQVTDLKNQLWRMESSIEGAKIAISDFKRHLDGPKFQCGCDLDGYINVSDVHLWLRSITDALNGD